MTGTSTVAGLADTSQRRGLWLRRIAVTALALFVLASLSGALGVRTGVRTTTGGGYDLTLRYPVVARAGLDTQWQVTVARDGGLPDELVLAVTADYFDLFEAQAFHPEPIESTRDGETLYLTFATRPGADEFDVAFDAYVQPAAQRGERAEIAVLDGGERVATLDYRTWLLP